VPETIRYSPPRLYSGSGRVFALLFWRESAILDLSGGDIDNQLSELIRIARAFFHFMCTCTVQATHSKDRPCSRTANPSVTLSIAMRKRPCRLLFTDICAVPSRPH
jgi:hypothetical protein